MQQADEDIS